VCHDADMKKKNGALLEKQTARKPLLAQGVRAIE